MDTHTHTHTHTEAGRQAALQKSFIYIQVTENSNPPKSQKKCVSLTQYFLIYDTYAKKKNISF
jgi:hypothetical protein